MTPEYICDDVKRLIDKLNTGVEPVYIDCEPEVGADIANCFPIVQEKILKFGGEMVLGWEIWKTRLLVEGEFHAIWRNSDGRLIDISPKPIPLERILFLPAPNAQYEGRQVDNVRINILGNRLVDDLIEICEALFKLQNKGDRANQYELKLEGEEARAFKVLQQARPMLEFMVHEGLSHQGPCPCESGKKYKNCHRQKILELARGI